MTTKLNTRLTIQFHDADDLHNFCRYMEKAKAQDGTVGGLWAGLVCSALKRASVKQDTAPTLLRALEKAHSDIYEAINRRYKLSHVWHDLGAAISQAQSE